MKITLEHYGRKIIVEESDESSQVELLETFVKMLIQDGYIIDKAEKIYELFK